MAVLSLQFAMRMRRESAAIGILLIAAPQVVRADDQTAAPQRPAIMFNRWQEDWSVLADPRVPRQPFDEFKYIPLSDTDRYTYLSFGADTRDRFESNNAANFGTGPNRSQNYVISRNEFDADLRIANQLQAFVQFQADYAPWKTMLTPVDVNRLDLEQAFRASGRRNAEAEGRPPAIRVRSATLRVRPRRSQRPAILRRRLGGLRDRALAVHHPL
jgi:hypothetical protein